MLNVPANISEDDYRFIVDFLTGMKETSPDNKEIQGLDFADMIGYFVSLGIDALKENYQYIHESSVAKNKR
jgi:hypothetical protein